MHIPSTLPQPLGAYAAVILRGETGFVSGQFPILQGKMMWTGRLGLELNEDEGRQAARLAASNVLGQIRQALPEHWDRVSLARLDGYIASAPGYPRLPGVLDAASELFLKVLQERGRHSRVLVPVSYLPGDAAVELAVTFHVDTL
ncbi:MAG: RidA family protein [Ramlibacter sp.]|nr:RidA family protein [Ramlibacter sp.]